MINDYVPQYACRPSELTKLSSVSTKKCRVEEGYQMLIACIGITGWLQNFRDIIGHSRPFVFKKNYESHVKISTLTA